MSSSVQQYDDVQFWLETAREWHAAIDRHPRNEQRMWLSLFMWAMVRTQRSPEAITTQPYKPTSRNRM